MCRRERHRPGSSPGGNVVAVAILGRGIISSRSGEKPEEWTDPEVTGAGPRQPIDLGQGSETVDVSRCQGTSLEPTNVLIFLARAARQLSDWIVHGLRQG